LAVSLHRAGLASPTRSTAFSFMVLETAKTNSPNAIAMRWGRFTPPGWGLGLKSLKGCQNRGAYGINRLFDSRQNGMIFPVS
jgi:hypothetical protein